MTYDIMYVWGHRTEHVAAERDADGGSVASVEGSSSSDAEDDNDDARLELELEVFAASVAWAPIQICLPDARDWDSPLSRLFLYIKKYQEIF
eukprot:COSAG01_NODE_7008_length_3394_cov_3.696813_5_plen_92_part_00